MRIVYLLPILCLAVACKSSSNSSSTIIDEVTLTKTEGILLYGNLFSKLSDKNDKAGGEYNSQLVEYNYSFGEVLYKSVDFSKNIKNDFLLSSFYEKNIISGELETNSDLSKKEHLLFFDFLHNVQKEISVMNDNLDYYHVASANYPDYQSYYNEHHNYDSLIFLLNFKENYLISSQFTYESSSYTFLTNKESDYLRINISGNTYFRDNLVKITEEIYLSPDKYEYSYSINAISTSSLLSKYSESLKIGPTFVDTTVLNSFTEN
jgi:hypothetical protein